jgi:hypothetical protein
MRTLQVQRDLYAMPRGMERFHAYIKTMRDDSSGDLALPLVAMNPMGKDHVPALIDDYLALDAEAIAEQAVADVRAITVGRSGDFRTVLVVSDDLKGGWTNRWASEFSHRFEPAAMIRRGWVVGVLWTSEPAAAAAVREAVVCGIYRALHVIERGYAKSLGSMLEQEGFAMAAAGLTTPALEPDDIEYTRQVIAPLRAATDRATQIACIFGDPAARALGYEPKGLSERAGLALALHDAARS